MLENKNYDILLNTDQDTSFNIFFETLENCIHDTNDLTDFNQATFMYKDTNSLPPSSFSNTF